MKFTNKTRLFIENSRNTIHFFWLGQPELKEWEKNKHLTIGQRIWCTPNGVPEYPSSRHLWEYVTISSKKTKMWLKIP